MFFDYSLNKFFFTLGMVLTVLGFVFGSVAFIEAHVDDIRRGANALSRAWSSSLYTVFFKLPAEGMLAFAGGASDTAASANEPALAKNIPVLVYHGEGAATSTMPNAVFVEQMHALKNAGWQTVTLEQFENYMEGTITLPDKSFLLTFDDGRRESFYDSDPVFKDLGYTAVMFVITGVSLPNNGPEATSNFYLSKSELEYMVKSGRWELESHGDQDHRSYTVPRSATSTSTFLSDQHFLSNKFWLEEENRIETEEEYETRIIGDLTYSKNLLESDFGIMVNSYAYPYNDFGQESVNFPGATDLLNKIVPRYYRFAFYQSWPSNGDSFNRPNPDAYFIKRIEPLPHWSGERLLQELESGRAKPLPFASDTFENEWNVSWGSIFGSPTELKLKATPSTTGAGAFLNGTESWGDYILRATSYITNGTLSLVARHTDTDAPYAVCAFSGDHIYLEQHEGRVQTTFATKKYQPPSEPGTRSASISVRGSTVTCSAYGVSISATLPRIPSTGGAGVSVWDPEFGAAEATLTAFTSQPLTP